jgi:adenine specific DNA methylase Mod
MAKEGNVIFKTGKKSEILIQRVLNLTTDKNDLVLDSFFWGQALYKNRNRRTCG